jgi:hypothetical protein
MKRLPGPQDFETALEQLEAEFRGRRPEATHSEDYGL